jgi:transposase
MQAIPSSQPALYTDPAVFGQVVLALRQQIARFFQVSRDAADLRSILVWQRAIIHGITLLERVQKARLRYCRPRSHLQFVAAHALNLIRYDFRSSGITRDADSFRAKCEKSDLNSPPSLEDAIPSPSDSPHPFLTPNQWQILEPLLPSFLPSPNPDVSPYGEDGGTRQGNPHEVGWVLPSPNPEDWGRGRGRGRPPSSPLPLLDAIFWKIAHHARWQDLPAGSPPMLTCRRYYRRLFLSGRLFTLYTALYQDLLTRGRIDLTVLVDQGCFTIAGNGLALRPDLDETWQLRTALLILQLAHQVSCRILRAQDHSHRPPFPL